MRELVSDSVVSCKVADFPTMFPRSAGNAASGTVPAGRALMDVKCP